MTAPKPIVVSVDGAGAVRCDPSPKRKRKGKGRITWVLDPGTAAKYVFGDLGGLPTPTFFGKQVDAKTMSIVDDNQGVATAQDYQYQVTLKAQAGGLANPLTARNAVIRNDPG